MDIFLNMAQTLISTYVMPVSKEYDIVHMEDGKGTAVIRAQAIRSKLGELYNSSDTYAVQILTQSLIGDFSNVLKKEVENIPAWINDIIVKTLNQSRQNSV